MTFENYYEIFKVRNPGKLNNIDKKILEDFWDKAQEEVDVSEYTDRIEELQSDLSDVETDNYMLTCDYNSAEAKIGDLEALIDELRDELKNKQELL